MLFLVIHDPGAYASPMIFLDQKLPMDLLHIGIKTRVPCKLIHLRKGLNYAKYLLVSQALQVVINLRISNMKKSEQVPFIGAVHVKLSNFTVDNVMVHSSKIKLGQGGINIVASQVEVNLTMNWKYSYRSWFIPFIVSDKGGALVKVSGFL